VFDQRSGRLQRLDGDALRGDADRQRAGGRPPLRSVSRGRAGMGIFRRG
jgi:hypothetical protein